jgi:peptidoglycan/xylan/chitin deacetylase (PgdA/CDA1 family)
MKTLDWDGLRGLADQGVEIESHTVTHAHLPDLADAELQHELVRSRLELEDELGRQCRFLAFPSAKKTSASVRRHVARGMRRLSAGRAGEHRVQTLRDPSGRPAE